MVGEPNVKHSPHFQSMCRTLCMITGMLRMGEGTPSYDAEMDVTERLPWEHVTGA